MGAARGARQPARDRPATRYTKPIQARSPPLVDSPVNRVRFIHKRARRKHHMQNGNGREVVIVEATRTPIGRGHPEKGYYKDTHPNELLAQDLHRGHRARRDRRLRGRGRDHRLRAAVRRADVQRRPQRLAPGRTSGRDAGHDRRPPVRLRSAGRELRRRADRLGRARRGHRIGRRAHGPHPDGSGLQVGRRRRLALAARADGEVQPRAAGHLGRDDRRPVGDPALGARRDRPALAPERRAGRPRRVASSARSCRSR